MNKLIVIAIIALTLVACASQFVTKEYRGKHIAGKSIGIYIHDFNLNLDEEKVGLINSDGEVRNFSEFFVESFASILGNYSGLSSSGMANISEDMKLSDRYFPISMDENLLFSCPEDGKVFKTDKIYYDFILILEKVNVDFEENHSSPGHYSAGFGNSPGMWVGGGFRNDVLKAGYQFVIWDNKNKVKVVYGNQEATAESDEKELNSDAWVKLVDKITKEIIKKTPFEHEFVITNY